MPPAAFVWFGGLHFPFITSCYEYAGCGFSLTRLSASAC